MTAVNSRCAWHVLCMVVFAIAMVRVGRTEIATSSNFVNALQKVVYSAVDGHLLVAGKNMLYKLDGDTLQITESLDLDDVNSKFCDSDACRLPQSFQPIITCLGTYNATHLFICTTSYAHCELRHISDLSLAAFSPENLVTGYNTGSVAYVKAAFQKANSIEEAIWIVTSYSSSVVAAISVRKPDRRFNYAYAYSPGLAGSSILSQKKFKDALDAQYIQSVKVIYAFAYGDYTFYVKNNRTASHIGIMCNNDEEFRSLSLLPLTCSSLSGETRKYMQSAYVSTAGLVLRHRLRAGTTSTANDLFLFGVFSSNATSTATSLCVFNVKLIISKMKDMFSMCFVDGNKEDVVIGPIELTSARETKSCQSVVVSFF